MNSGLEQKRNVIPRVLQVTIKPITFLRPNRTIVKIVENPIISVHQERMLAPYFYDVKILKFCRNSCKMAVLNQIWTSSWWYEQASSMFMIQSLPTRLHKYLFTRSKSSYFTYIRFWPRINLLIMFSFVNRNDAKNVSVTVQWLCNSNLGNKSVSILLGNPNKTYYCSVKLRPSCRTDSTVVPKALHLIVNKITWRPINPNNLVPPESNQL